MKTDDDILVTCCGAYGAQDLFLTLDSGITPSEAQGTNLFWLHVTHCTLSLSTEGHIYRQIPSLREYCNRKIANDKDRKRQLY